MRKAPRERERERVEQAASGNQKDNEEATQVEEEKPKRSLWQVLKDVWQGRKVAKKSGLEAAMARPNKELSEKKKTALVEELIDIENHEFKEDELQFLQEQAGIKEVVEKIIREKIQSEPLKMILLGDIFKLWNNDDEFYQWMETRGLKIAIEDDWVLMEREINQFMSTKYFLAVMDYNRESALQKSLTREMSDNEGNWLKNMGRRREDYDNLAAWQEKEGRQIDRVFNNETIKVSREMMTGGEEWKAKMGNIIAKTGEVEIEINWHDFLARREEMNNNNINELYEEYQKLIYKIMDHFGENLERTLELISEEENKDLLTFLIDHQNANWTGYTNLEVYKINNLLEHYAEATDEQKQVLLKLAKKVGVEKSNLYFGRVGRYDIWQEKLTDLAYLDEEVLELLQQLNPDVADVWDEKIKKMGEFINKLQYNGRFRREDYLQVLGSRGLFNETGTVLPYRLGRALDEMRRSEIPETREAMVQLLYDNEEVSNYYFNEENWNPNMEELAAEYRLRAIFTREERRRYLSAHNKRLIQVAEELKLNDNAESTQKLLSEIGRVIQTAGSYEERTTFYLDLLAKMTDEEAQLLKNIIPAALLYRGTNNLAVDENGKMQHDAFNKYPELREELEKLMADTQKAKDKDKKQELTKEELRQVYILALENGSTYWMDWLIEQEDATEILREEEIKKLVDKVIEKDRRKGLRIILTTEKYRPFLTSEQSKKLTESGTFVRMLRDNNILVKDWQQSYLRESLENWQKGMVKFFSNYKQEDIWLFDNFSINDWQSFDEQGATIETWKILQKKSVDYTGEGVKRGMIDEKNKQILQEVWMKGIGENKIKASEVYEFYLEVGRGMEVFELSDIEKQQLGEKIKEKILQIDEGQAIIKINNVLQHLDRINEIIKELGAEELNKQQIYETGKEQMMREWSEEENLAVKSRDIRNIINQLDVAQRIDLLNTLVETENWDDFFLGAIRDNGWLNNILVNNNEVQQKLKPWQKGVTGLMKNSTYGTRWMIDNFGKTNWQTFTEEGASLETWRVVLERSLSAFSDFAAGGQMSEEDKQRLKNEWMDNVKNESMQMQIMSRWLNELAKMESAFQLNEEEKKQIVDESFGKWKERLGQIFHNNMNYFENEAVLGFLQKLESQQKEELIKSLFTEEEKVGQSPQVGQRLFSVALMRENLLPIGEKSLEKINAWRGKYGKKGETILGLVAYKNYDSANNFEQNGESVVRELARYETILERHQCENIPPGSRTSIGMEYEMTRSLADNYAERFRRNLGEDMVALARTTGLGQGRDAVFEIATHPTDNPYLMMLEMYLLQESGWIDFNFKTEGMENAGRGMHLTIGGETGINAYDQLTHFLENVLMMSDWGGVNAGDDQLTRLSTGRSENSRERSSGSVEKVFERNGEATEMRNLSIDSREPFERVVLTSYYGAMALQTYNNNRDKINLFGKKATELKSFNEFDELIKNSDHVAVETDETSQKIIMTLLKLFKQIQTVITDHNANFLDSETIGYLDESGQWNDWVDARDFGGQNNMERFLEAAGDREKLEKIVDSLHINYQDLFKSPDPKLANQMSRLTNLYIKASVESGGDRVNAAAILDNTKLDHSYVEDGSIDARYLSVFDRSKRKERYGYYNIQGGSEKMIIHAVQRALLEFKSEMEQIVR